MKSSVCVFIMSMLVLSLCVGVSYAVDNKWEDLIIESNKILKEMAEMPEKGIPSDLIEKCEGIAIFPSTIGAGFIIGGKYGQGVIARKLDGKWSAPAVYNLGGGSFGWQIGGQATDIILLIMNDRGMDGLLQSKFKLGADAAVAAGPMGREAQASTDAQMKSPILSYSRSRGLFAGVSVSGSVISPNEDGNVLLYGKDKDAKGVLKGRVEPTDAGKALITTLNKYSK